MGTAATEADEFLSKVDYFLSGLVRARVCGGCEFADSRKIWGKPEDQTVPTSAGGW